MYQYIKDTIENTPDTVEAAKMIIVTIVSGSNMLPQDSILEQGERWKHTDATRRSLAEYIAIRSNIPKDDSNIDNLCNVRTIPEFWLNSKHWTEDDRVAINNAIHELLSTSLIFEKQ